MSSAIRVAVVDALDADDDAIQMRAFALLSSVTTRDTVRPLPAARLFCPIDIQLLVFFETECRSN